MHLFGFLFEMFFGLVAGTSFSQGTRTRARLSVKHTSDIRSRFGFIQVSKFMASVHRYRNTKPFINYMCAHVLKQTSAYCKPLHHNICHDPFHITMSHWPKSN
jgi:hypothetical protein